MSEQDKQAHEREYRATLWGVVGIIITALIVLPLGGCAISSKKNFSELPVESRNKVCYKLLDMLVDRHRDTNYSEYKKYLTKRDALGILPPLDSEIQNVNVTERDIRSCIQ